MYQYGLNLQLSLRWLLYCYLQAILYKCFCKGNKHSSIFTFQQWPCSPNLTWNIHGKFSNQNTCVNRGLYKRSPFITHCVRRRCNSYEEATRLKQNVYFLDLVDLELTYFGWCFKVIPFLTDYDHYETRVSSLQCSLPHNKNLSQHNQAPWCSQPRKKSLTLEGHHK